MLMMSLSLLRAFLDREPGRCLVQLYLACRAWTEPALVRAQQVRLCLLSSLEGSACWGQRALAHFSALEPCFYKVPLLSPYQKRRDFFFSIYYEDLVALLR